MKKINVILFFYFLLFIHVVSGQEQKEQITAILGAFKEEILLLENSVEDPESVEIFGMKFTRGKIHDKNIVLAYTGMGKVNAAMTTTLMIEHFSPSRLIFTGIAGGINPELNPGDIVISEKCVQHDLVFIQPDTLIAFQPNNPVDDRQNPVYFISDSLMLNQAISVSNNLEFDIIRFSDTAFIPKVIAGTIATGDAFIASSDKKEELIKYHHADCVEMEGAAVAQICYQKKIPFIVIRSISDSADENAKYDVNVFLEVAAGNSASFVLKLLEFLN